MVEIKKCTNCRFRSLDYKEEPCYSCCQYCMSKWEPEEEKKDKFKTGDVITHKNDTWPKLIYIYLRNDWVLCIPSYVLVRSKCDYRFSNYANKLICNGTASHIDIDNFESASSTDITEHDSRAKRLFYAETLNEWFSRLIRKEPKKPNETFACPRRTTTDPETVYEYQPKALITSRYKNSFEAMPKIEKVIFNPPATIVQWKDGTKTVVKCQDGDEFDWEKGLAMAYVKRAFNNERTYYGIFKKNDPGVSLPNSNMKYDPDVAKEVRIIVPKDLPVTRDMIKKAYELIVAEGDKKFKNGIEVEQ